MRPNHGRSYDQTCCQDLARLRLQLGPAPETHRTTRCPGLVLVRLRLGLRLAPEKHQTTWCPGPVLQLGLVPERGEGGPAMSGWIQACVRVRQREGESYEDAPVD